MSKKSAAKIMEVVCLVTARSGKPGSYKDHGPGALIKLPAAEAKAKIALGLFALPEDMPVTAGDAAPADPLAERVGAIAAALGQLTEEDFGADGVPNIKVVTKAFGGKVNAAERDAALALFKLRASVAPAAEEDATADEDADQPE